MYYIEMPYNNGYIFSPVDVRYWPEIIVQTCSFQEKYLTKQLSLSGNSRIILI